VVWSRGGYFYGDVYYLTGYHALSPLLQDTNDWTAYGSASVILSADSSAALVMGPADASYVQTRLGITDQRRTVHFPDTTAEVVLEFGMKRIGLIGADALLWKDYQKLAAALGPGTEFRSVDFLLEHQRAIKSPAEIALIRNAIDVGTEWMRVMMEAIRPGTTEGEIVGEGLRYLVAHGGRPEDVMIAAGTTSNRLWGNAGVTHWDCRRKLETGDLVHIDAWGPVDGYYTDFARSTVVGRHPSPEQRRVLEDSVSLIEAIVAEVRPGVTANGLCSIGNEWLNDHKYPQSPRFFGHCIGLGVEPPWLIPADSTALKENMVLAIEVGLPSQNGGIAYFEHNVLVTADGHELLSAASPSRWWD
jgi:Xaa-Pro aminopeptidase